MSSSIPTLQSECISRITKDQPLATKFEYCDVVLNDTETMCNYFSSKLHVLKDIIVKVWCESGIMSQGVLDRLIEERGFLYVWKSFYIVEKWQLVWGLCIWEQPDYNSSVYVEYRDMSYRRLMLHLDPRTFQIVFKTYTVLSEDHEVETLMFQDVHCLLGKRSVVSNNCKINRLL